jgi:hypothetical protein
MKFHLAFFFRIVKLPVKSELVQSCVTHKRHFSASINLSSSSMFSTERIPCDESTS